MKVIVFTEPFGHTLNLHIINSLFYKILTSAELDIEELIRKLCIITLDNLKQPTMSNKYRRSNLQLELHKYLISPLAIVGIIIATLTYCTKPNTSIRHIKEICLLIKNEKRHISFFQPSLT